jgi:hypothetical protein
MPGVLLSPVTGRPIEHHAGGKPIEIPDLNDLRAAQIAAQIESRGAIDYDSMTLVGDRIAATRGKEREGWKEIFGNLEKGWHYGTNGPRNSLQTWHENLYCTIADGAQVLNTVTETIMVPNFLLQTGYLYPGRSLRYTLYFDFSTVITTPGTMTLRLRWNGVAGTVLAASGAFAPDPTAAGTAISGMVQFLMVCRSIGAAGNIMTMGILNLGDYDDASAAALKANVDMSVIPTSAPAQVAVDTTVSAPPLSPTVAFSVATATTQLTTHLALLETLS